MQGDVFLSSLTFHSEHQERSDEGKGHPAVTSH